MTYKDQHSGTHDSKKLDYMLAEVSPSGIILVDPTGACIYVNKVASRMTGYSIDELMGGVWMIHPDDTTALDIYERALREETEGSFYETRLVKKDGSILWVSISWRPVRNDQGEFIALCTFMTDISERKTAEEALLAATERYKVLAENSAEIFWEMSLDGKFIFVSPAVRRLGYEPEEWIGHRLLEFLPEDEQAVFLKRLSADITKLKPCSYEVRALRKDGTCVWMEVIIDFALQNGKPQRIQGAARDIAARVQAQKELQKSEQKYKSIVENSSDLIMLTQSDGTITYASPSCNEFLGYEPEEIIAMQSLPIHPDDKNNVKQAHQRAVNGEPLSNFEYRIITKSGDTRWLSQSWSPQHSDDGQMTIINMVRNVTKRKLAEQALHETHTELEHAYQLQREFLNNVTHEVRTPLTAVIGYAEMLIDEIAGPVSSEQTALLKKLMTSSEQLLDIVNSVLRIARMKSGKVAINPKACDPRLVVEQSVSTVMPQAIQKGIDININAESSVGIGIYDEEKLTAVITNLLTNAVKFTNAGSIEVSVNQRTTNTEIIVADSGIGIDESGIVTIFDEFAQLDQPRKHKPTGFGIGLAIVAAVVETMGASLIVSSAKDIGTAFTLHVPALEAATHMQSDSGTMTL